MKTFTAFFQIVLLTLLMGCASDSKKDPKEITNAANSEQQQVPRSTQVPLTEPDSQVSDPATQTLPQDSQASPPSQIKYTNWSYKGITGPDMWGDIDSNYAMCKSGKLQSPIDLLWSKPKSQRKLEIHYNESSYDLEDNGHSLKVNFVAGNYVLIDGIRYDLKYFNFRSRSEHSLSGQFFPLEGQFYHENSSGEMAILSVFFKEGKSHPYLEGMLQQLPSSKNRQVASTILFDPGHLIPISRTHYNYVGSLTTPPCTEGVNWNVFNTPVEMSSSQMQNIKVLYTENYRPQQRRDHHKVSNY